MTILLRTLTEKSKIEYGKHKDMLIGDLLRTNKTYLIFMYLNYERITFSSEIISQLNLRSEDIIAKPGTKKEAFHFYSVRNNYKRCAIMHPDKKLETLTCINRNRNKSKARARLASLVARERISFSKGIMQYRNHK